jgi:predicted MPP superfamily phosphohydrolase
MARILLLVVAIAAILTTVRAYRAATSPPLLRKLVIRTSDYPAATAPIRIAFFSDVHVHGPDMPPTRVDAIVAQINALHPDIDIAGGDYVGDNWIGSDYTADQAIAPLRNLRARLGVYAILGNNDYAAGAGKVLDALRAAGIQPLINAAVRVGPLSLGGLDGRVYRNGRALWSARRKTYAAVDRRHGMKLLVSHNPDEFHWSPTVIGTVLAGHTHCGQLVLPLIGPLETGSSFGRKYLCGILRDGPRLLVVTAGLGTSHVPLRIGAPPDIWLITVEGPYGN